VVYLGATDAIEHGLVRKIEAVRDAIKGMKGAEAETWLRRRLTEVDQETEDERPP
jgi:hypothetical protein